MLDSIQVFDSYADGTILARTVEQLFQRVSERSRKRTEADELITRLSQDHLLVKYTSKLQAAVLHTVPVLFMGGQTEDYAAVSIKRMCPASGKL